MVFNFCSRRLVQSQSPQAQGSEPFWSRQRRREGQGTIADFDPSRGFVWAEAGIFHIPEVFPFGNGAFAQGLVFDSFQKCLPALLFHTGSYQISHTCILR